MTINTDKRNTPKIKRGNERLYIHGIPACLSEPDDTQQLDDLACTLKVSGLGMRTLTLRPGFVTLKGVNSQSEGLVWLALTSVRETWAEIRIGLTGLSLYSDAFDSFDLIWLVLASLPTPLVLKTELTFAANCKRFFDIIHITIQLHNYTFTILRFISILSILVMIIESYVAAKALVITVTIVIKLLYKYVSCNGNSYLWVILLRINANSKNNEKVAIVIIMRPCDEL